MPPSPLQREDTAVARFDAFLPRKHFIKRPLPGGKNVLFPRTCSGEELRGATGGDSDSESPSIRTGEGRLNDCRVCHITTMQVRTRVMYDFQSQAF